MKWNREQYLALMSEKPVDRPMFCELFGLLVGLEEEWKAQGATPGELDLSDFSFDYVTMGHAGANNWRMGGLEPVVLEDNDTYRITRDELGRTMKLVKGFATIPLPLDFPVKDMESWLKIKPFFAYNQERINHKQLQIAAQQQKEGALIIEAMPGGYNMPRELMGEEALSYALYDQPDLIHDMLQTFADTACRVFEEVCKVVVPDVLNVHEDMAGKTGPLLGPDQVNEFIKPYYTAVWEPLKKKGTKLFSQDSDGNMNPVMDAFIACGVNAFYPLEPAAGMDIVRLREKYGKQIFYKGGLDKHVLRAGRDAIKKELEYKFSPMLKEGGCVFALDHRIPNGTPLADYKYYVDTAREMLGLPHRSEDEKRFVRMAF